MLEIRDKLTDELIEQHRIPAGTNLHAWLSTEIDDFEYRETPPISIFIKGVELDQAQWKSTVVAYDLIVIYPEPKATLGAIIIKALVTAAVSYAISALTSPKISDNYASSVPQGSNIYSANAQGNSARLNGIIPEIFGTHKYFPDLLSAPYRYFENDEQYIVLIMCLGVGSYQVDEKYIGQTPIDRYAGDYDCQVFSPGWFINEPNFRRHIYTSLEVGNGGGLAGIELDNDGTAEYYGPYLACPINETTNRIWLDFVNNGLATIGDGGAVQNKSIELVIEYRDINSNTWIATNFTKSAATTDQLGETLKLDLGAKITPEVRIKRLTENSTGTSSYDTMLWTSLRSELDETNRYNNITVVGLTIRGSNNLAGSAENKFNVVATRYLKDVSSLNPRPIWEESRANGAIDSAFYYMATSSGLIDSKINLERLYSLRLLWAARGDTFNAVFAEESTIFECFRRCLAVGFAYPTIRDGRVDIVRESSNSIFDIGQMFTPDNTLSIVENGVLFDPDAADGVQVEYFSEETWKPETLLALVPGDAGLTPEEVRAFGITNKTAAWRYAMRVRNSALYVRRTWVIETELEGLNCHVGEMVSILGRKGQHGWITDYHHDSVSGLHTVTTNKPLALNANPYDNNLIMRADDGTASVTYLVTATSDPLTVALNRDPEFIPTLGENGKDPTLFQFGAWSDMVTLATVKTIEPQGDTVRLELAEYSPELFADDDNTPPE